MTHDLFISLMHAYGLQLEEAFIHKFEDGIFSSQLTFMDMEGKQVELDARTSDAIALAVRSNAPIYTTRAILDETGFVMEQVGSADSASDSATADDADTSDPAKARTDRLARLREAMQKAIDEEQYEEASRLKSEIEKLEKEDA